MAKKLTSTAFNDNGFTTKVNKAIIRWVVQNQDVLASEYQSKLKKKATVRFCLDLRTVSGATLGLTVKADGRVSFTPYAPSKKAVDWLALLSMGCPEYSK